MDLDLPGLATYIRTALHPSEKYDVVYVDILSLPADSLIALKNLHANFIVKLHFKWLVVVGDAKTYTILQNLK